MKGKIAMLKLAGFETRKDNGLWEWYLPRQHSLDGQSRLGKEMYEERETAWDSAWRYMNGDAYEEFDNEPWNTPKELIGCPK